MQGAPYVSAGVNSTLLVAVFLRAWCLPNLFLDVLNVDCFRGPGVPTVLVEGSNVLSTVLVVVFDLV